MKGTELKKAPFLKEQPEAPLNDLIILAGSEAWETWGKEGKGEGWRMLCDLIRHPYEQKPVILGSSQLAEIEKLQLVPSGQKLVKIYQFGKLTEPQKMAISLNIAKNSEVQSLIFCDNVGRVLENTSEYISRLRQDDSIAQLIQKTERKKKTVERDFFASNPTRKEIAEAFLEWRSKPLGRDIQNEKTLEYNGLFWETVKFEMLERRMKAFFDELGGEYRSRAQLASIVDLALLDVEEIPTQNTDFIGFQNGVLNKKTGEFLPHNIKHYLRNVEHFPCNTDSTETPYFDDWLEFVSNGNEEKRSAILAGLYMVLTNRHEWGLFLEATGTAGAGKSIMAQIASMINGSSNTTTIALDRLEEPTGKGRAVLLGKSFAYSPDQKEFRGTADTLKAITGGDPVMIKTLYVDEFSIQLELVYMIVTNHPLQFIDRNGAILRRRVIFEFDRAIPKEKKDVHFAEKVRGEIFGITQKLLNTFTEPEIARMILENYRDSGSGKNIRSTASHLVDFASHFTLKDERKGALRIGSGRDDLTKITNCETLYSSYTFYCECHDLKRLNLRSFKSALPDVFREAGETIPYSDKIYNGYPTTNAYWKDKKLSMQQWAG